MSTFDSHLSSWIDQEKWALRLINAASALSFDRSVELVLFRRRMVDRSVSEVLNDHEYARGFAGVNGINARLTAELAEAIGRLDIAPARLDVGVLAKEWIEEGADDADAFIRVKLADFIGVDRCALTPRDVVLYGFGRIGRLAARMLTEQVGRGQQLRLRAIVVRPKGEPAVDLAKRASLLRKDSVHGKMAGTVTVDVQNQSLVVNGSMVKVIYANQPDEVDYTAHGIENALLIDNTGVWKDREGLGRHLQAAGVEDVLLTAPAKGNIPNIVYGVNHEGYPNGDNHVYSAASCTTNAIAPAIALVKDTYGITDGHIETVHAYTNDQNLTDNYHKKVRRGRGAPLNMVLTSTGAGKAVVKIFPELDGLLTANAIRVPTPNVSMAILSLNLETTTSADELNQMFRNASLYGDLVEQISYSMSSEHVSTDVVGNPAACEIDALNTIVSQDGKRAVIYAWYDNEFGYTAQVIRLAKHLAGVRRLTYYSERRTDEAMHA